LRAELPILAAAAGFDTSEVKTNIRGSRSGYVASHHNRVRTGVPILITDIIHQLRTYLNTITSLPPPNPVHLTNIRIAAAWRTCQPCDRAINAAVAARSLLPR
jgi:hypothetical protein